MTGSPCNKRPVYNNSSKSLGLKDESDTQCEYGAPAGYLFITTLVLGVLVHAASFPRVREGR
jgi:hypothetical protein